MSSQCDVLRDKSLNRPEIFAGLTVLSGDIVAQLKNYGAISHVPTAMALAGLLYFLLRQFI